ncbi:hypothetical protein CTI14_64890, partial [Methylobacterium radiotolerans]
GRTYVNGCGMGGIPGPQPDLENPRMQPARHGHQKVVDGITYEVHATGVDGLGIIIGGRTYVNGCGMGGIPGPQPDLENPRMQPARHGHQ